MSLANVVCMKWGDKYPAAYVNRLFGGVRRFLKPPFRFLCFTDKPEGIAAGVEIHPLPSEPFEADLKVLMYEVKNKGAWRKVSLFKPGLAGMEGPILGFDIDVVVTGPLEALFDFAPGKVCMRREWRDARRLRQGGHGSVFRFDPAVHGYLYSEFAADPMGCAARVRGSEQRYTSLSALRHGDLEYFPPRWIASFKYNVIPLPPFNFFTEPHVPKDARVVCFHGRPSMEEALAGYRAEWWRSTRPADWLVDYWLQGERNA